MDVLFKLVETCGSTAIFKIKTCNITSIASAPLQCHERHGVSNHRQLDYMFNSLFRLTSTKTPKLRISDPFWCKSGGNPPITAGFPSRKASHHDVIKWKHFPRYWPFVLGIHRSPVNSPLKGQWRRALMFALIFAWINGWVNNREAGDLRRYRAHYDVTVMKQELFPCHDGSMYLILKHGVYLRSMGL